MMFFFQSVINVKYILADQGVGDFRIGYTIVWPWPKPFYVLCLRPNF